MTAYADTARAHSGPERLTQAERLRRIERLRWLARIMDTAFRIPGTGIRFGADSLLGLVPAVGDASGALIGLVIVNEARRLGVPRHKIAKMVANLGIDALFGAVPLVGDAFDVYFKSHKRNIAIILDHFDLDHVDIDRAERARPVN